MVGPATDPTAALWQAPATSGAKGKRPYRVRAGKILAKNLRPPQPLTFDLASPTLGFPWRSNA